MSEDLTKDSLQKSVKIVGELYPVLTNQDGKILDGSHRIESNPKHYRKIVQTKNRMEEILVRLHAHHRRRIPQEETRVMLLELAEELEKSGIVKEKVAGELVKLVPYGEGYVLQLLPNEFKEQKKVEAGRVGAQLTEQKLASALIVAQTVKTACPKCFKVFDSTLEYRLHWSHSHYGPVPAPLTQPAPASSLEETPLTNVSRAGFELAFESAPAEEPKPEETMVPQRIPEPTVTRDIPKPKVTRFEPESILEGTPICPICGVSMDATEYKEVKEAVAVKFGRQIQTLLFPSVKKA